MTKSMRWFALGAAAVALGACSDSIVSPPTRGVTDSPSLSVTPGTNSVTLASDGTTQHCSAQDIVGNWAVPAAPYGPFAGCGTALDLTTALAAYNPGWSAPFAGSSWIGVTANGGPSSDYRAETGRYVFQETFNIPTGATAPSLSLNTMSDNAVAVFLNGHLVAAQAITDCLAAPCNWAHTFTATDNTGTDFVIGGSNTVTVLLVGTPIGYGDFTSPPDNIGGPAPTYGCYRTPQTDGWRGTANLTAPADTVPTSPNHVYGSRTSTIAANGTGCENPTGVDYHGTVSWTPPASTIWCSPGFWKNAGISLWIPLQGLAYDTHGPYPNDPQTFVGYDFGKKVGLSNPTMLQVISNPSIYGGPATNNVASFIAKQLFGTPESANPTENCPDVLPLS